jgi:adenine-specific DNA-methyltransferase
MDKQTATQLIGDTFNYPFDEGRFRNFAINLLNDVNETKGFDYVTGTYIRHSFKNHITKYRRLGTYADPNGEKIDVLVVQLKNEWALERSRTMLRNFTSDYLKNRDEKDAALVAYYTTNPDDWRFSYIRMEYKREKTESGKFKITQDITPAKRYSFLVGKNEPNHTAQEQLSDILADDRNNPTLTELETAFSVDAVTKQFYKDYRAQFEKLWNELNDIVAKDQKIAAEFETQTIDTANFAKKLMGQIVFLYFLQKKGWLGVGKDEKGNFKEWGTGPKNFLHRLFKKEFTDYGNFFNDVLEPLFYEALATERTNDVFTHFNCKIPFLNGGLFEPINDYNWEETDIRIDNDMIGDLFKTFDQYNFTVREDEPLEKEVAVDPEMLGKVFENLLPENLRKGNGAYYTPRAIVHYMCQESLINYLDTECEAISKKDIETLIREGDIILELETAIVEDGKKYKSVLMDSIKDNAQALDDALANIKVCDPAIGSGAFSVGMLTEIVKARKVMELYLDNKHGLYELKRHCIQTSLYGVDIDPGAIEIAKLRLWLSLVVDEADYTTIQPLPNLDYKIMQGNSLIEEFYGISLDIEKKSEQKDLFAGGRDLDTLIDDLHQKQDDFFNAEHPREKKQKRDAVETAIYNIFHNELEKKKSISSVEAKEIETDLKEMTHGKKERNFFPWKLYFADVFREKGGFDVVIANPPYGASLNNNDKALFKEIYSNVHMRTPDTFNYFISLSFTVMKSDGIISFIVPNNLLYQTEYEKTRRLLVEKYIMISTINLGDGVFDTVTVPSCVFISKKNESGNYDFFNYADFRGFKSIRTDFNNYLQKNHISQILDVPALVFGVSRETINIINKVSNKSETIDELALEVASGISTGGDKIFRKSNSDCENLNIEHEILKPVLIGSEIDKYSIIDNNHSVIYSERKIDINKYKNIKSYLFNFKDKLSKRSECQSGVLPWYSLNRQRYHNLFLENKIIMRQTSDCIRATIDTNGYYVLDSILIFKIKDLSKYDYKFCLALLNSKINQYIYKNYTQESGRTFAQVKPKNIRKLFIPEVSNKEQEPFIGLVNQVFDAKKINMESDTTPLEAEIDQLVYELYGLTDEEIAIVEESVG